MTTTTKSTKTKQDKLETALTTRLKAAQKAIEQGHPKRAAHLAEAAARDAHHLAREVD